VECGARRSKGCPTPSVTAGRMSSERVRFPRARHKWMPGWNAAHLPKDVVGGVWCAQAPAPPSNAPSTSVAGPGLPGQGPPTATSPRGLPLLLPVQEACLASALPAPPCPPTAREGALTCNPLGGAARGQNMPPHHAHHPHHT